VSDEKHEQVVKVIQERMEELRRQVDGCHCFLASLLENGVDEVSLWREGPPCEPLRREARLKEALREAIEVLEESRKSFKSKRLEALRKRLTAVLIETG